jgi:hypothetical protein
MVLLAMIAMGSCKHAAPEAVDEPDPEMLDVKGDSMIYGLACDGCTDSVAVIWPFEGEPRTLSIIDARMNKRVIGKPEIGDWIGVMIDPNDSTVATMLVNMDQLKGTWTYPVMPVMKDYQHMSRRMQRRMMENMPDSVKNTFLVPREYGFTLSRNHLASPVGYVYRSNTLEDDSPVTYPKVQNYKQWHMFNGKLLLVSGEMEVPQANKRNEKKNKKSKDVIDTLDFISLSEDSLILNKDGVRYGFHRKANAREANAAASAAAQKLDSMKMKKTTKE